MEKAAFEAKRNINPLFHRICIDKKHQSGCPVWKLTKRKTSKKCSHTFYENSREKKTK
jgi:hypothetical protein